MILIISFCPVVGVPLRFVVNEVIAAARAVIVNISTLSVLIVGVALEATVPTLGVTLLFVKVVVEVAVGIAVPHTVGGFVLSISVNQPFVTLEPVAAIEPVIVKLFVDNASVPPDKVSVFAECVSTTSPELKSITAQEANRRSENFNAVVPRAAPSLAVGVNPVVIVALVRTLLVRVSAHARVASVPVVGKTTVPAPAVAAAFKIVEPLVEPARISFPTAPHIVPNVFAQVTVCTAERDISPIAQKLVDISAAVIF